MKPSTVENQQLFIKSFVNVFILIGIYYSTLKWLIVNDWARKDYSYGILIPFVVLYLIWEKKKEFQALPSRATWKGLILVLPGICLFWLGELAGEIFIQYLSLWLVATGLCWLHMGKEKLKLIFFPLFFALTMFPLPSFFNSRITLGLKLVSTKIGVLMMRAWGMSAFQDGNIIDLGFTTLQVVDACSGLRYLMPLLVLGILTAYFFKASLWKKAVLILSTIPITILTNSVRIALTGILSQRFGVSVVEGFFHDFEGWFIFMAALSCLGLEMMILSKIFPEPPERKKTRKTASDPANIHRPIPPSPLYQQPRFMISTALLMITALLSYNLSFREAIPMGKNFNTFPMKIRNWRGTPQVMENKFITTLDFSDYIMVDYDNARGKRLNFYVAYYETQKKGESIHSPATCLRGGGWEFRENGGTVVKRKGLPDLPVNRAVIQKGDLRQLSYYWFPMRGRILTNAFQMKWYNFWDALTQQRTDGALVRVITPVEPDEHMEDTEKRLQGFVEDISPVLTEFLPGG